MKNRALKVFTSVIFFTLTLSVFYTCDNDDSLETISKDNTPQAESILDSDIAALVFMLEEEKLARDTYKFLANLWSINQFTNIQKSEQTHMNAVENLLKQYNISYEILPDGQFINDELQTFYNQFIKAGSLNTANAFQIGATIEDLDIVDLQKFIDASSNASVIAVFENLQCGSRNHLKSFLKGIEAHGGTYTPQFLSKEDYLAIINSSNEKCGKN